MDLLDDPAESKGPAPAQPKAELAPPANSSSPRELSMRRLRKVFIFAGACALALVLSVRHQGQDLQIENPVPVRAAVRQTAAYDLSQLPVITKTLFYVRENYFDKSRFDHKRMLVGALDFLQRDVPEILIDRYPERDPKQVKVRVGGQEQTFNIERVDSPWTMRGVLQDIFKFVQPNLQPVTGKEEARRLLEVEIAAANGMLYTLDPHSVLLDVESFKDMRTQTQGKFGGLGIVINLDRKGRLYVVRPMPETPAIRAGIKAKDRIVRINNESTMNMTREEAVERLRGDVGSSVDVYVERTGVEGMKKFPIVRDMIRPPAIENVRVLNSPSGPAGPGGKVGYFRITQFNANTERDLMEAMATFEKEKVKGVIMDLRANPGGLYDQAQKVADAFIDSGVLVSMVGVGGSQRKDEHASRNGNVKVPLAVLVNQLSASASEIVAGAVKNLDRGVVVGETTFGKGSVQMLFDIPSPVSTSAKGDDDRLGLKLTTAQYLTPGDLSIQGVGVTPDVDLVRLRVQKTTDESIIQLQRSNHRRQESDYEWHLDHPSAQKGTKPAETLSYLFVPSAAQEKREQAAAKEDEDDEDAQDQEQEEEEEDLEALEENIVDFPMEFARDLLANTKAARRREMLQGAKSYLDKVRAEEDKKLSQALEKLGVDWTQGPANPPAGQVQVTLSTPSANNKVVAGETVKIRGTVKNVGSAPVYRVHALLASENPYFDENEMVFGKIAPGESKNFDLNVKVAKATLTRTDVIRASVFAQGQLRSNTPELTLSVEGKARPLFAYSYQTVDDVKGNNDGRVQLGEKVRLLVKVKNIGQGAAVKTEGLLRNGPGQEGILISAGRFEGKDLAAGASKTFAFVYDVGNEFKGEDYTLELMVGDSVLGESVTDKIKIKVAKDSSIKVEPASGTVTAARSDVALREAPVADALLLGKTAAGAAFKVTGKAGAFTRVELEPGRPAFIATSELKTGGTPKLSFHPAWQVMPPVLVVKAPSVIDGNTVTLKGQVTDDVQVKDLFVRVYNKSSKLPAKKVFYLPNRGEKNKLPFSADVPLWPGSNIIQVFARETTEVQSVATLIVMRKSGPSVAQAPLKDSGSATGTKPAIQNGRSGMTTR
jgi:carboxyl-terminal processing protease